MRILFMLLLLAACSTPGNAPEGYVEYCTKYPERVECGGTK